MKQDLTRPTVEEIDREIGRRRCLQGYQRTLMSILCSLAVISAIVILVVTLWMPVLQITGSSMEPTLEDDQLVVTLKTKRCQQGDVIAFYHDNRLLIKRVIATAGQSVDVREDGTVLVDGVPLEEPYVKEKSRGACNIQLPYQVETGQIFVMGDDRPISVDSRSSLIGTISTEQILGQVLFRVWPLTEIGRIR